jgi:hypothetical protein
MPDGCWERSCWKELHRIYELNKKGKLQALEDCEVDELIKLAQCPRDWYIRSSAQRALLYSFGFEDNRYHPRLQSLCLELLDDSHPFVRGNAATGLARLRTRDAIPQILVRIGAARPRSAERNDYINALKIFCQGEVEPALAGIPRINTVVQLLLAEVADENQSEHERMTPAYVLGQIGPDAKEAATALRQALATAKESAKKGPRGEQYNIEPNYDAEHPTFCWVLEHSLDLIEARIGTKAKGDRKRNERKGGKVTEEGR